MLQKRGIFDDHFSQNKGKYVSQCLLATFAIFATLLSLNIVPNDVVIASMGATSFTVFAMPHKDISRARYVLGGYVIGVTLGSICYFLARSVSPSEFYFIALYHDEFFGAIAVGFTMFLMVILNSEHPPAAACALGLVIDQWSIRAIIVLFLGLVLILSYRHLFRRFMINLL